MKVFLLGATGNLGRRILKLVLSRAHEVTAFVRDETKLAGIVRPASRMAAVMSRISAAVKKLIHLRHQYRSSID